MSESFDQYVTRTLKPLKPLPEGGSALVFQSGFFNIQMDYGACRGSAFEHFVIGDLTVVPSSSGDGAGGKKQHGD